MESENASDQNTATIIGIGAFKWKKVLKKGAFILKSWIDLFKTKKRIISQSTLKVIRDKLLNTLKSNYLINQLDPHLPMFELTRDESNAYNKTLLQEHLYQMLLKEWQIVSPNFITHKPYVSIEEEQSFNLQEFELHLSNLIMEVLVLCN